MLLLHFPTALLTWLDFPLSVVGFGLASDRKFRFHFVSIKSTCSLTTQSDVRRKCRSSYERRLTSYQRITHVAVQHCFRSLRSESTETYNTYRIDPHDVFAETSVSAHVMKNFWYPNLRRFVLDQAGMDVRTCAVNSVQ